MRHTRHLRVLLALLFVGVAVPAEAQETSPNEKPESAETEARASEDASSDGQETGKAPAEQLLEEADDITERVASLRELRAIRPIDKGIREREELRKILIEKLAEEQSPEETRREGAVFRQLDLIPGDLDYREMILDVLTEQIAGFYDPKRKSLNIMRGIPVDLQRPAMAHEIFHAIQDQHFDLENLMGPFGSGENGDFQLARQALIEGDATILMVDYTLHRRGTLPAGGVGSIADLPIMSKLLTRLDSADLGALEQFGAQASLGNSSDQSGGAPGLSASALGKAPSVIRRALLFPYLSGMQFVLNLRKGRTWEDFDRVYSYPPVSTEQILHPERYAARDEPVMLEFAVGDALGDEERIYRTVFGEFQIRLLLEEHLEPKKSKKKEKDDGNPPAIDVETATTGWDGDRLQAYRLEGRPESAGPVVVHLSVWDTLRDAREYFDALGRAIHARFPKMSTEEASGEYGASVCGRVPGNDENPGEGVYLERWGDLVLHVEGLPTKDGDEEGAASVPRDLRDKIWSSLDRRPFREVFRERRKEADKAKGEKADTD